jgi:hypothetical protein
MDYTNLCYLPYHGSASFRSAWNNWPLVHSSPLKGTIPRTNRLRRNQIPAGRVFSVTFAWLAFPPGIKLRSRVNVNYTALTTGFPANPILDFM